jgi:ferritin
MEVDKIFEKPAKKMYLSDKTKQLVDSLIAVEFNASQLYKSAATWCEYTGFTGSASWLNKHVDEERAHMNKLYEYSLDRQCNPITPAVKQQQCCYTDLKDVLEVALKHEEFVEAQYKAAIKVVLSEPDMTTFGLFQFYLGEQIEEIKTVAGLLDRLEVIGNDKKGQFFLDQEIGEL